MGKAYSFCAVIKIAYLLIYMSFQTQKTSLDTQMKMFLIFCHHFCASKISLIQKVLKNIVKVTSEFGLFSHVNQCFFQWTDKYEEKI